MEKRLCTKCGRLLTIDHYYKRADGRYSAMCKECQSVELRQCRSCGNKFEKNKLVKINGQNYCAECAKPIKEAKRKENIKKDILVDKIADWTDFSPEGIKRLNALQQDYASQLQKEEARKPKSKIDMQRFSNTNMQQVNI